MIFLYTVLLLVLGLVRVAVSRRASRLAGKFSKVADRAAQLMKDSLFKPGNGNKSQSDILAQTAKRQFELGSLITQRDRLEAKYLSWQNRADRLSRLVSRVKSWKGQKLPYTLGAADVWLALYIVDRCGVADYLGPSAVMQAVGTWLGW